MKLLSNVLNISIDELLDNNINNVLVDKVSNTEKLAGMIIKILKFLGIAFIILLIINIIAFVMFNVNRVSPTTKHIESIELSCSLHNDDYLIEVGTDGYFNCSNCPKELQKKLKHDYVDYEDLSKTEKNISNYFKSNHGTCEE